MNINIPKVIAGCLGCAGNIWSIVRWVNKSGLTAEIELGPPEYAAILALCTSLIIWSAARPLADVFRWGVQRYTERGQFQALTTEIGDLEQRFSMVRGSDRIRLGDKRAWKVLSDKLASLQIYGPEKWTNSSVGDWLSHTRAYAERGKLEDARRFAGRTVGGVD